MYLGHVTWTRVYKLSFTLSMEALYEPRYEKSGFVHMRNQRRRSASR